jgi:hypothetical protein
MKKFEDLNFDAILCCVLAHSAVHFCREWHSPLGIVDDAMNIGGLFGEDSESSQATTDTQVAGQGGGEGSENPTIIAGASSVGANATGDTQTGGYGVAAGARVEAGGTLDVTTDDVNALNESQTVTVAALQSNTDVTGAALASLDQVATGAEVEAGNSIAAGVAETEANDQFGEQALASASALQSTDTTALEQEAEEFAAGVSQLGNNALAAAQNETLAGITPGQAYEEGSIQPSAQNAGAVSTIAAWLGIIGFVIAGFYFILKKPKT